MNKEEFTNLREDLLVKAIDVIEKKGVEYAHDEDVLANFKRNAERLNVSPALILGVYLNKHEDAIDSILQRLIQEPYGDLTTLSESVESRFIDAINYLLFTYAYIVEHSHSFGKIDVTTIHDSNHISYMTSKGKQKI